jgi:hypothetical protein
MSSIISIFMRLCLKVSSSRSQRTGHPKNLARFRSASCRTRLGSKGAEPKLWQRSLWLHWWKLQQPRQGCQHLCQRLKLFRLQSQNPWLTWLGDLKNKVQTYDTQDKFSITLGVTFCPLCWCRYTGCHRANVMAPQLIFCYFKTKFLKLNFFLGSSGSCSQGQIL